MALFKQLSVLQCETENFLVLCDGRVPGNLAGARISVCLSLTIRLTDPQINLEVRVSHKENHGQPVYVHPGLLREACLEMGGSEYTKEKGVTAVGYRVGQEEWDTFLTSSPFPVSFPSPGEKAHPVVSTEGP